jgi:hypothetical protein
MGIKSRLKVVYSAFDKIYVIQRKICKRCINYMGG